MAKDNQFTITFDKFYQGFSPMAFSNNLTEFGGSGHASTMANVDVIGDTLTQGPGLSTLTNGNQTGAVGELINYIMDKAVANDTTYGIGATKLYQISSTAVTNAGIWPHTITNCTDGSSVCYLKGVLYYLYNKSSGADIGKYDLSSTFDDDWGSTVPTGAAALTSAIHPVDKKEDIMVFGNGRYVGTYIVATNTIDVDKLDFGNDCVVADVIYDAGFWWIAVNSGISGTNRTEGQIYLWEGGATEAKLADETGVGMQRIGFIYRINGIKYVAYQDLSSTGFIIGYISGSAIKPLGRFTGTLPTFAQKTLYKNTILTLSSGLVYSAGAYIDDLPFQISQIADGGYATCGALAAPFGTPMVASYESSSYKLAKFSGYDITGSWKSVVIPLAGAGVKGQIDQITVLTKALGANARCDVTIEANQGVTTSNSLEVSGTGETEHNLTNIGLSPIEDMRVAVSFANGNATNNCQIRKIIVSGHWVEY